MSKQYHMGILLLENNVNVIMNKKMTLQSKSTVLLSVYALLS
jgi:hypothetical protein